MLRSAIFKCDGRVRTHLSRTWDQALPRLLVVMFNPSSADASRDDPTVTLLCLVAAFNGFGAIDVMNGIPLVSSGPGPAIELAQGSAGPDQRHSVGSFPPCIEQALVDNLADLRNAAALASSILIAWGAIASAVPHWFLCVRDVLEAGAAAGLHAPLMCLGRTAGGFPLHPMARGRFKVAKTAMLKPWSSSI